MLSLKQLTGYLHAPQRHVRRLAETAAKLLEQVDEQAAKIRRLEEQVAASQSQLPVLIVLHRDGFVEVVCRDRVPVHIVCRPDLGTTSRDEQAADKFVLDHMPRQYRELLTSAESKVIATGNCRCCLSRTGYQLIELTKEKLAACWLEKALREPEGCEVKNSG